MTDPFAAVQVPSATSARPANAGTGTATAVLDPFTSAQDSADPFAVSSDFKGGDYTPSPSIETLSGRLCVMIPRSLDPNAKDPNDPNGVKTREVYTVDLTVLSGGRLTYPYRVKGDVEKGTVDEWKDWIVEDISPSQPFTITHFWVPQGGIIGRLKKAHAAGAPFLGVVSMEPTKAQRDRGVTVATVRKEYADWVARGRAVQRPSYTWVMADPDASGRAAAIQWWATAKDSIAPIVAVQH